ncbi:MAG: divergent PAP2 family protein [Faecalibacterium sp.]
MELLKTIITWNPVITCSACATMSAQILKSLINFGLMGKFSTERMFGDGGMPSSHTATVCATLVAVGRYCGTQSGVFALALVFATVTMRDAMGVRRETGEQAKLLNKMINNWIDQEIHNAPPFVTDKKLKEMVGHTPIEVLGGAILGILVGAFFPLL